MARHHHHGPKTWQQPHHPIDFTKSTSAAPSVLPISPRITLWPVATPTCWREVQTRNPAGPSGCAPTMPWAATTRTSDCRAITPATRRRSERSRTPSWNCITSDCWLMRTFRPPSLLLRPRLGERAADAINAFLSTDPLQRKSFALEILLRLRSAGTHGLTVGADCLQLMTADRGTTAVPTNTLTSG